MTVAVPFSGWLTVCVSVESLDVYLSTFLIISARSNLYVTGMFMEYLTWFYKTVDHCDVIVSCRLMILFYIIQTEICGIKSLQCTSCIVK